MSTIQNLRKSLVRNWKPVCSLVGYALSGAQFAPFWLWLAPASHLPPGDGPVLSQLALLWYCSVLCSVNGLAVFWVRAFCRLISLSLSLAIPQFRLLSHISSLSLSSGHSGPVLNLSNAAAHSSPFSPHLLVADVRCLSFDLLYFVLPPFKDNGLLFWVPDVFCQCSEVVLWSLLSVQIFFQWICGGESGFPVLFLHHLSSSPHYGFNLHFHKG